MNSLLNEELKEYYNYVKTKKRLSCNELTALLNQKDNLSKKQFIEAYLYYVFIFAYRIYMRFTNEFDLNYSLMDFIQDGNLLLLKIIYNQKCMNDIGSFNLYFWLNLKRILEGHIVPTKTRITISRLRKLLETKDEFYKINRREATIEELMKLTNFSRPVIESIFINDNIDISELDDEYLAKYLGYYEFEEESIERLNQRCDREIIDICMKSLSKKQAHIITSLYGLEDGVPKTLDEIGKEYGFSKQYIHEINNNALSKMRRENYRILKKYHNN